MAGPVDLRPCNLLLCLIVYSAPRLLAGEYSSVATCDDLKGEGNRGKEQQPSADLGWGVSSGAKSWEGSECFDEYKSPVTSFVRLQTVAYILGIVVNMSYNIPLT
ncbi:Hypp7508 [Branchiostoma lanceolatum]|uniref:Hypp7508 protein n=1 Tax=Branchiostoma lanceolatum TaxID=7740 RepID=A0A8J9Z0X7_BRALA|nr:Hypp7508 [Branchiostoma lanceolatum]